MYVNLKIFQCIVLAVCSFAAEATTIFDNTIGSSFPRPLQYPYGHPLSISSPALNLGNNIGFRQSANPTFGSLEPFNSGLLKRRCPVCDSSVYGYCNEKLFHDSCCCQNPNNPYEQLPYQCQYADCSFLHANSCREHELITACCCTNYRRLYRK